MTLRKFGQFFDGFYYVILHFLGRTSKRKHPVYATLEIQIRIQLQTEIKVQIKIQKKIKLDANTNTVILIRVPTSLTQTPADRL